MNKKEINHSIQEYFDWDYIYVRPHQIKDFIYDEILPEVLESVMPWNWDKQWDEYSGNDIEEEIKNIAKKQYNINL